MRSIATLLVPLPFALAFCTLETASAACGLDQCPPALDNSQTPYGVEFHARRAEFELFDTQGNYTQYSTRFSYRPQRNWSASLLVPAIQLDLPEESMFGLGNSVAAVGFDLFEAGRSTVGVGAQWEIPTGNADIVDDHHEALLWAEQRIPVGSNQVKLVAGFRRSFGSVDNSDSEASGAHTFTPRPRGTMLQFHGGVNHASSNRFVNPHDDEELLWRIESRASLSRQAFVLGLHLEGNHVVSGSTQNSHFLLGGADFEIPATERIDVIARARGPLSTDRRFDWLAEVGFRLQ